MGRRGLPGGTLAGTAGEPAGAHGMSAPEVSRHLALLRKAA